MDEVEYRLRDLDVVTDHAGRLPSAAELRRRGERRRTAQRTRLAVATFAVVALVAGGVTAVLGGDGNQIAGTPSGNSTPVDPAPDATTPSPGETTSEKVTPAPEATSSPPTGGQEQPTVESATLEHETGGNYWIWAPPTADGAKRQLTAGGEDVLDLSRKNKKKPEGEWYPFYGQLELIPVPDIENGYLISNMILGDGADKFCVTALEGGFALEACDEGDAKQAFTMTEVEGGYTISSQARDGIYLLAEGRSLSWTPEPDQATVFAMEEYDGKE